MKNIALFILALGLLFGCDRQPQVENVVLPVWHSEYKTTYVDDYFSGIPEEDEMQDVQCPIPMECRVRNYTRIQCVFSSLECLARWAECSQLLEPEPLTSRPGCKQRSDPRDAAAKLENFGVKFENSYRSKEESLKLLKRAMKEGRGALMDVPGHAIVICHYDEQQGIVKIIDNSDRSLRIQTWPIEKFNRLWGGWIMVIYADEDIFPAKARTGNLANKIPIVDRNGDQKEFPKNYIPFPSE